jgi:hypothetical protein
MIDIHAVRPTLLCQVCGTTGGAMMKIYLMTAGSNESKVHGSVHRNNILIYIQQDATLHSLFYLETALHISGGITTYHQERKQLHLLFVTPLLLSTAIVEELEAV